MAQADGLLVYLGEYTDREAAMDDFEAIKALKHADFLGMYESALFEKTANGELNVINTDATERTRGAKIGAITGGVIGLLFPPSILAAAAMGTGIGAIVGHFQRGLKKDDIESMAELLQPGDFGVVVVAETTIQEGFDKLMKHAAKVMKKEVDVQADELKKAIDEAAS
jgi:uncharacterized membrane protein